MRWYVYMLRCEDDSLYTGIATDVERRFGEHSSGRGAKYTRAHPPRAVVYREECADRGAALRRESAIKKLPRAKKLALTEEYAMRRTVIDRAYAARLLPERDENGHKGTFGKLLILGGSVGYTGAPYLASCAAEHAGCGLVRLGVPESIWAVEAAKCAGAMPFPLAEADGKLCPEALARARKELENCDVLALGPGLGRGAGAEAFVHAMLATEKPLVLDADGLNALEGCAEKLDARRGRATILTPHDGEFARLSGCSTEELATERRAELARTFACAHSCVLVLKGHRTLVALPDGSVLRNTSGCSALAKGGSGDVLTGVIAALLCQRMAAGDAAALGVWLHGRAGELLAEEMTAYCVTAEEVAARGLARAFREAEETKKA